MTFNRHIRYIFAVVFAISLSCERSVRPSNQLESATSAQSQPEVDPALAEASQSDARNSAREVAAAVGSAAIDVVVPDGANLIECGEVPDGMQCVPGGWFLRGVPEDSHDCDQPGQPKGDAPTTTPQERVWVSTFFMDETEVTNAAYESCVAAGDCPKAGPQYRDFDGAEQAITGVSWFDARAYCASLGKRLPTEAEFEKAARGPNGEAGPFGDVEADCEVAIVKDERGRSCGVRRDGPTPLTGRVMEVKSRPPGRYGLYDIVGNAEEWVADWMSRDWEACGEDCRGVDPKGPCGGADECEGYRNRAVRGGSWYWPASHATGYHRRPHIPSNALFHHFGFRCAKSTSSASAEAPR